MQAGSLKRRIMFSVTMLLACHSGWNLQRALTWSGRDDEDNSPEKPWLRIWVEMGSRCDYWQTISVISTGSRIVSKMKIKTNGELGNMIPFLFLSMRLNIESHGIIVTWDFNRIVHNSSVKLRARGAFCKIRVSVNLIAGHFKKFPHD